MEKIVGKLIVVEGLDGVGKSTQVPKLQTWLHDQGIVSHTTCEPGGSEIGNWVRDRLKTEKVDNSTALFLLLASRNKHYHNFIKPALQRGEWMISDRFSDSTYAYQTFDPNITEDFLDSAHEIIMGDFKPDCTIILDLKIPELLQRLKSRALLPDAVEETVVKNIKNLEHIRSRYLERVELFPERYLLVSALLSPDDIFNKIIQWIKNRI